MDVLHAKPDMWFLGDFTCPICAFTRRWQVAGDDSSSQQSPYFRFEADVLFKITETEPLDVS
jgi:hypothetical protein